MRRVRGTALGDQQRAVAGDGERAIFCLADELAARHVDDERRNEEHRARMHDVRERRDVAAELRVAAPELVQDELPTSQHESARPGGVKDTIAVREHLHFTTIQIEERRVGARMQRHESRRPLQPVIPRRDGQGESQRFRRPLTDEHRLVLSLRIEARHER